MATTKNATKTSTTKKASAKEAKAPEATEEVKAPETAPEETAVPVKEPEADRRDEEIEVLKTQIEELQKILEAANRPQVIQVAAADEARVHFLWQAEVADDNVVMFGDGGMYGRIVGKTGTFSVPKSHMSRLLDGANRRFLDDRWLIVLDGLDEDEREMMGVNYREGELLDRRAFARMVDLEAEILEIYPRLCPSHKEMVAKRYNEAFEAKSPHIKRDVVVELNRMSKAAGSEKGDFQAIIEAMNAADAE